MLIEDDATARSLLEMFLGFEGFKIAPITPTSLDATLAEVLRVQPEVILLDVNLIQFTGYEFMHELRAAPAGAKIKVLMSSGEAVKERCLDAGADGFLPKPYMPDQLAGALRSLIS